MASYTFLNKFLLNNRCLAELSQINHHVYFKNMDGLYLASNNQMLSFLDFPAHEELVGRYKDKDLVKNSTSLEMLLTNDRIVIESKSVQIFMELAITETKQQQFFSIKAPLYGESEIIGLCGISLIIDNYKLTEFNDLLLKVGNMLQDNLVNDAKFASLKSQTPKITLTPRELQCLQFYMQGHSLKYIATMLCLSHRTIEYYLENIKSKFGVKKRSELLPIAFNLYPELV